MSGVAAAMAGTAGVALITGHMGAEAARDAANTQARAARDAAGVQKYIYDQQRSDNEPWRQAGMTALTQMQDPGFQKTFTMSDFNADPGYQFRMNEGQKALERQAAAKGVSGGGATMKALARYGQDYSSGEYQKAYDRFNNDQTTRYNRLASLAGVGQTANQANQSAGSSYGSNVADLMTGAANAQAAGTVGQANAISNALGTGMNTWMNYQMMNRMKPTPGWNGQTGSGTSMGATNKNYFNVA
jgi:hypothetical protein